MKSTFSKKGKKIELGKRTNEGYKYGAKIDFAQDLSAQISRVIKEKEINETIEKKVKEMQEVVKKFPGKEKNLQYYYEIGKKLSFLDNDSFKNIAPYSIFRRVIEESPEVLPNVQEKEVAAKHLDIMYKLAHVGEDDLSKATWDQWYEILKFKEIYKDKKLLEQILTICEKESLFSISLRERIKEFRRSKRVSSGKKG